MSKSRVYSFSCVLLKHFKSSLDIAVKMAYSKFNSPSVIFPKCTATPVPPDGRGHVKEIWSGKRQSS